METFVTEYSPIKDSDVSVLDKGRLLYNLVISSGDEEYAYGNIIDEGGDKLLNEHSGQNLLLDSTDGSGTNAGSQLLMEDDSGTDQIILNQTASDGSNSGAEIVMEDAYDVVGDAILDSSGASRNCSGCSVNWYNCK